MDLNTYSSMQGEGQSQSNPNGRRFHLNVRSILQRQTSGPLDGHPCDCDTVPFCVVPEACDHTDVSLPPTEVVKISNLVPPLVNLCPRMLRVKWTEICAFERNFLEASKAPSCSHTGPQCLWISARTRERVCVHGNLRHPAHNFIISRGLLCTYVLRISFFVLIERAAFHQG